ncbi:MAG: hypothetical protein ABFC24_09790 [Methanoregulaceae archaeon]
MPPDIGRIVSALKDQAVGRCRERLEHAAGRTKAIIGNGIPAKTIDKLPSEPEEHGVTSLLKRKHGL